jgi:predicted O-linked N-acetylglucosamine transferase (SPINDLY family)
MRGRHTYAILKMMGLEETIAKSIEDYIDIAVKLGKDKGFRKIISEKIASNKNKVYRDNECIEGLEKFFEDVVYSYSKKVL